MLEIMYPLVNLDTHSLGISDSRDRFVLLYSNCHVIDADTRVDVVKSPRYR